MYNLKINFQTHNPQNFNQILILLKKQQLNFKFLKNLKFISKIPLKKTVKNFTVLKSPHVNKKSQEHFQYKKHKFLINITNKNLLSLLYFNFLITNFLNTDVLIKSKLVFIA